MPDEFDDLSEPTPVVGTAQPPDGRARKRARLPRLVSRLYGAADDPLRARLLECLLRPLGTLGLAAVAGGTFAGFLLRSGSKRLDIGIEDVARVSGEQVLELARFVEQCNPQTFEQVAALLGDNPLGAVAFTASVAMLLVRALKSADEGADHQDHPKNSAFARACASSNQA